MKIFIRFGIAFSLLITMFNGIQSASAAPPTPANIKVVLDTSGAYDLGSITVSWDAILSASGYTVLLTREDVQTTERQSVTGAENTSVQFVGLKGGKSYIVQVRSIVIDQASAWSADSLKVVPKTAPKAPTKPTATVDVGKATVTWSAVATVDSGGFDISSYLIREVGSGTSVTAAGTATSAEISGLLAGSTVEFTVTAINAANSAGSTSTKSDAVTIPSVPALMSAPTIISTATDGEAGISWVAPASNGGNAIVNYTVKLLKGGVDLLTRVITDISNFTTTFTGLTSGSYSAKVSATNGVGANAFSLESSSLQVTRLILPDTPTATPTATPTPAITNNNPIVITGGGAPVIASTSWFHLFIADSDNLTLPYPFEACATLIERINSEDRQYGPLCASKSGVIDFEVKDGEFQIRAFDKQSPEIYKEYRAKVAAGVVEVAGSGYRGGDVARRVLTVPSKVELPTPSPTPTASASTTPQALPSPSASPSPIATGSTSSPSPTPSKVGITTKTSSFAVATTSKVTGTIKSSILSGASTSISLKSSANFQPTLPIVKKGEKVTMNIKDSKGKSYTVASLTVSKSGSLKLPAIKFTKTGKYTITIKVGTKTKIVKVTSTK